MGRILHLSDLHFGRDRAELVAPLIAQARALRPDITVISGDLTQRARPGQFAQAAKLIAALPGPVLSVPGNHDMPLHNPLARLFFPYAAYRRAVGRDLEPLAETADLVVICLNTADPMVWQRGHLRAGALERVRHRLGQAAAGQLRVVAFHHPLQTPPATGKTPMKGADAGAEILAEAGADVILTGHLHLWAAAPFAIRKGGRAMLCVQAGTTLSTRVRGEENDFNVIDHDAGHATVTRWRTDGDDPTFRPDAVTTFRQDRHATGWGQLPP